MLDLHRKHPQTLASQSEPRGVQIAAAFDTFLEAENLSQEEQVRLFQQALQNPLMRDFTVLLKSSVLVDLMGQTSDRTPEEPVQAVIREFAEKIKGYLTEVDRVLDLGRKDPFRGARALEGFLANLSDEEQKENLDTILGLLREADADTAKDLLNRVDDATILRLVENNPGAAKNGHVRPERLLTALNITPQAHKSDISEGIIWMLNSTAGNFQIDAPFTKLAHQVIADVAARNPRDALAILQATRLPLTAQPFSPFIMDYPRAAINILSADLEAAAALIAEREGYAETPHGIVHALIFHDPVLAGKLVMTLDEMGRDEIVECWQPAKVGHFETREIRDLERAW